MVSTYRIGGHPDGQNTRHAPAPQRRAEGARLEACAEPGASVARIALENGLNANLVHKWRRRAPVKHGSAKNVVPAAEFVPLPVLPSSVAMPVGDIRISIRRGGTPSRSSGRYRVQSLAPSGCVSSYGDPNRCDMARRRTARQRAGTETALARVIKVFGEARVHHAYLFANRRATRMKVLVHDGSAP